MLERATSCLESAGRRFLRDPNSVIRSRRSLPSRSWMHNPTKADVPHWFLALLQVTGQRPSPVPNTDHGKGTTDGGGMFLDFLCPQQAQRSVGSGLSRPQKKPAMRRRRSNTGFVRSYTSASGTEQAISTEQTASDEIEKWAEQLLEPQNSEEPRKPLITPSEQRRMLKELDLTFQQPSKQYNKVWKLYLAAGSPPRYSSAVLSYLSDSTNSQHQDWAWTVFQTIPHSKRSSENYQHILSSQYLPEPPWDPPHVVSICNQALFTPLAGVCIKWSLLYATKNANWSQFSEIWTLTSKIPGLPKNHLRALDAFRNRDIPASFLVRGLLSLVEYLELGKEDHRLLTLARLLFDQVLSDDSLLWLIPTSDLLQLIEKYRPLGVLQESAYMKIITRLHSSDARPEFVQSILFYRQFRSEIPDGRPPKKLLVRLFDGAVAFEMTDNVTYLLDEFAQFQTKPSISAYREALKAFSKARDVSKVHQTFDRLVVDHGNPKSRKLLTPLLSIHAHLGDARETQRHFDRISAEFGLRPNTICWNLLIQAYVTAENPSGAASTLARMMKQHETPNSHTYGTIMALFAKRGDASNVRQLFYQAKLSNVEITMPMVDILLRAYLRSDEYFKAESLVREFWESVRGGSPMHLWNTLLWYHAFKVQKRYFSRLLGYTGELGLDPDAGTYAAIMYAHAITRQAGEAHLVLSKMAEAGIEPTEQHYSLLMLAYMRKGDRDMVHVILHEMQARLGKVGKSASLLNLRTQLERDLENAKRSRTPVEDMSYPHAEAALMKSINQYKDDSPPSKTLSFDASGSAKPHAPALHYQHLIKAYGNTAAIDKTHQLLDQYLKSKPSTSSRDQNMAELPVDLIKSLMFAHLKAHEFMKVEEYWNLLWPRMIKSATRLDLDRVLPNKTGRAAKEAAERTAEEAAETAAQEADDLELAVIEAFEEVQALRQDEKDAAALTKPTDTIEDAKRFYKAFTLPLKKARENAANTKELFKRAVEKAAFAKQAADSTRTTRTKSQGILRSQQFIMSFPLDIYMKSLAADNQYLRLHQIVSEVQAAGFALTAKNWSSYIELLTLSEERSDQIKAFQLFEEKFQPNFPGWYYMMRGFGRRPDASAESILHLEGRAGAHTPRRVMGKKARDHWWRIQPDYMHPSYRVMVYLARRLQLLRRNSIHDGGGTFSELFRTTPETLRIVAEMPRMDDPWQMRLLRGRQSVLFRLPKPISSAAQRRTVRLKLPTRATPDKHSAGPPPVQARPKAPTQALSPKAQAAVEETPTGSEAMPPEHKPSEKRPLRRP
ncbi:hypothetical protein PENANT_c013G04639 [Penicillium antarcticum]|uniref:PROP1-like PPR domain-containing protein n=1 Tax=Penicillium antarcticum TaxID=416450 RepID=A0A1V6Q4T9_9EURO|nr:hypothetical protein PENANT_c013G04639 [Penicillium antarcticum]